MGPRSKAFLSRVRDGHAWLRDRGPVTLAAALLLEISAGTPATGPDARRLLRAAGVLLVLFIVVIGAAIDGALSALAARVLVASRGSAAWARRELAGEIGPTFVPDALLLDRKGKPLRGAVRSARAAALARDLARDARARTVRGRVEILVARATTAAGPAARWMRSAGARLAALRPRATALLARSAASARAVRELAATIPLPQVSAPALPVRTVRVITVGVLMSFVFATVIGTTGLVATQGTVALGASTTLAIIAGEVRVIEPGGSAPRAAADGDVLQAGMTILTGHETYAVLTYFEGSTVSIDPDTTLVIEALQANPDGTTIIGMRQDVGQTWHAVTKLLTAGSKYEVRTPTTTATVRGTLFLVGVQLGADPGVPETVIQTTEGAVAAERPPTPEAPEGEEVIVAAGFTVTARPAAPIPPPVPAPEPERKVTVSIGAANSLVVDPQGRANGERDGRLVVQTPGATVERVDGKVVVTMPNVTDGKVSTVVGDDESAEDVEVVTVVEERGRRSARSERTVRRVEDAPTVTGIELRRSADTNDTTAPPDVRQLEDSEATSPVIKVSEVPAAPAQAGALGRPDSAAGGDARGGGPATGGVETPAGNGEDDDDGDSGPAGASGPGGAGGAGGAGGPGGAGGSGRANDAGGIVQPIVALTLPPLSADDVTRREAEKKAAEQRSREDQERRERERRAEEERRLAELRQAEQRANVNVERLTSERRRAEESADERRENATPRPEAQGLFERVVQIVTPSDQDQDDRRVREARAAEERAKQQGLKAEEERRRAEEQARANAIKAQEAMRQEAERRAEQLRQAEGKAKEDEARKAEEFRKLEEKAREQASKLAEEQRKEAEKRLEEFRKAEEKAREQAAKKLEEQRKAEDKAREEAAQRLEELRKEEAKAREEQRAREEQARREEEKRRSQESERGSGFVPSSTLRPLPGVGDRRGDVETRGAGERGSRVNEGSSGDDDGGGRGRGDADSARERD